MSRQLFQAGLLSYKAGEYQEALKHFTGAAELGGPNLYLILDSRAAVHTKLGQRKEALRDARKTIDVASDRWQGYARAARVFLQFNRPDSAQAMVKMALDRLKDHENERRASLMDLEAEVRLARQALERHRSRTIDHVGKLPIELFGEVARIVVEDDQSALVTLLHVCRHWRAVVESSPQLWRTLILTWRKPKQKAKLWIERSKGHLHELIVRETVDDAPHWSCDSLLGIQWGRLRKFGLMTPSLERYLVSIDEFQFFSNLDELEIDKSSWAGTTEDYFIANADERPLRHLTVVNCMLDTEALTSRVKNLRSFTASRCHGYPGSWAPFLEANPFLETLTLNSMFLGPVEDARLHFNHLTSLQLTSSVPFEIYSAEMPQLRILRLTSPTILANHFIQHLVDTNVLRLTELCLRSCRFSDMTPLVALLRISPDLESLEVSNTTAGVTSIIEALAAHYSPPNQNPILKDDAPQELALCPRLTHVNFTSCPEVQTGPVVRLIKSQLPPALSPATSPETCPLPSVDRIQSLIIDYCPNVDATWLPKLKDAVAYVSCVYTTKKTKYRAAGPY